MKHVFDIILLFTFIFIVTLLFVWATILPAHAHTVDRDMCGKAEYAHLGLDDQDFCNLFVEYWHIRRPLELLVGDIRHEYGRNEVIARALSVAEFPQDNAITHYFETVPAEPITQYPLNFEHARGQIVAAQATTVTFTVVLSQIRYWNDLMEPLAYFWAKLGQERVNWIPPKKKGKK